MHCASCGLPTTTCRGGHHDELEPPRFCDECGRKLDVQVTPVGFSASCRKHGAKAEGRPLT